MRRFFVAGLACVLVAGLGAAALAQQEHEVETRDNVFEPASITVQEGDRITFVNTGEIPHTAEARDGSFDTGNLNAGQSETVEISGSGTIEFFCEYHDALGMVGTIEVQGAGAAPETTEPTPTPEPTTEPTESPEVAAAGEELEDVEAQIPLGIKIFPIAALGMAALFGLGVFAGWVRSVLKSTENR
jgi:plastocyanin